jgi:hypothetical protein
MSTTTPTWSYGVTTVPDRLNSLLPATLESLARAGFDSPRLFVDDAELLITPSLDCCNYALAFIRAAGNWVLSAWELYARNPDATYYLCFRRLYCL